MNVLSPSTIKLLQSPNTVTTRPMLSNCQRFTAIVNPCRKNVMSIRDSNLCAKLVLSDQILIKDCKAAETNDDLEKETTNLIEKLTAAVEKIEEMEKKKFKSRIKGMELSDEESLLVENMSTEIVSKLLERPVGYLRSGCGNVEERMSVVNFLVTMLEESCLTGK